MWRRAHGRLAAIAVLAGGLSSCLPTPRRSPPIRTEADVDDEGKHEHVREHFICGGVHRRRSLEDLTQEISQYASNCTKDAAEKYGEVHVARGPQRDISVDTTRTHGLTEEDRRCIDEAVRKAMRPDTGWTEDVPISVTVYALFGQLPPLLPPLPEFAGEWQAALASPAARERLRSKLPEEAVLEDDGCISFPARPAFTERMELWLKTAGPSPDPLWSGLVAAVGINGHARVYVLANKALIVQRMPNPARPHWAPGWASEVCVRPWDEKLRRELRAFIEQRASCATGDLAEMLLHPRIGVPAGRPFKSVAVGQKRVCAIDDRGRLACCGERTVQDIPAAAFTEVAIGTNFDCGVTVAGDLYCWGQGAPAYGSIIKGPFAHVANLALANVCAIRRDTRALECWNPDQGRMVTASQEKVRSAAVDAWGVCALLEAGPVLCRDSNHAGKWYPLKGSFRTLVASQFDVCGVTGTGDGIACRERWPEQRRPPGTPASPRPPAVAQPAGVVLSGSDGCVVERSGRATCWPPARNQWRGIYRMIAGWGDRFCAVTVDGRVQCDREWPSGNRPDLLE